LLNYYRNIIFRRATETSNNNSQVFACASRTAIDKFILSSLFFRTGWPDITCSATAHRQCRITMILFPTAYDDNDTLASCNHEPSIPHVSCNKNYGAVRIFVVLTTIRPITRKIIRGDGAPPPEWLKRSHVVITFFAEPDKLTGRAWSLVSAKNDLSVFSVFHFPTSYKY